MTDDIAVPPVSIVRLFLKMGGWVVLITGLSLLMFTFISHLNLVTAQRFRDEGIPVTALVIEKYSRESRDSDGDRSVTYYLTLDYETDEGEQISLNRTVSSSEYKRAQKGQHFDLLYLRSKPRKTELTPGSYQSGATVTQVIALVMGLLWLAALWMIGGWAVAAVRARRYGTREEVEVVEIRRTGVTVNGRARYRLVWRDAGGREGKSLLHKADRLERFGRGEKVGIYHGLKHSWWVGDVGERP